MTTLRINADIIDGPERLVARTILLKTPKIQYGRPAARKLHRIDLQRFRPFEPIGSLLINLLKEKVHMS